MNLSGIAVVAERSQFDSTQAALAALPGVEIAQVDRAAGRMVLVQEADSVDAELAGFLAIRGTRGVLAADLVCHYFGDQPVPEPQLAAALARLQDQHD